MDSQIILIYGSHELEISEEIDGLTHKLLGKENRDDGLFVFDCDDFLKVDATSLKTRLQDFSNAVESVSFFATQKAIVIKNLQSLPKKKSPIEKIEKELAALHLVKIPWKGEEHWFDKDSLSEPPHDRHHITAKHLIEQIEPTGDKSFFCQINRTWKERKLWIAQGDEAREVSVEDFLQGKLKSKVVFEAPKGEVEVVEGNTHQFLKRLLGYLEDPTEGVSFVLGALIKKPEELPKPLLAAIQQQGQMVKKTVSYDNFLPHSWVLGRARKKGLNLTQEAAGLLIEIVGSDLTNLDHELEKLFLKYGEGASPGADDLISTVSHSKRFSVFLVGQYLAERDLKNALELIRSLLGEKKNESLPLLGLIGFYFRRLLKIRWLVDAGLNDNQVGQRLSQKYWQIKDSLAQVRGFQAIELEYILIELANKDLQLKTSGGDPLRAMEDLAYLVCRGHLKKAQWVVK